MLITLIRLLRIHHWLKNLFLFAAPFFAGALLKENVLLDAIPAFMSFSLGTSSIYIFNDIIDRKTDRLHPRKRHRPIASGRVSLKIAIIIAVVLLLVSFYWTYSIGRIFFLYLTLYITIQFIYTVKLKNVAILDIFFVAAGFVIRVLAGGAAFGITVSPWLFSTMLMISLVLACGKRLSEVKQLKEDANSHRTSLKQYSDNLLLNMLIISSATSLMSYTLYCIEQSQELVYTLPVVTFGLFRYLMDTDKGKGDATEALITDRVLSATVVLWLLMVYLIRY